MDLFNSKPHTITLPPPPDTLGGSLARGFAINVGVWFGLTCLTPILHLPPSLAAQVLILSMVALAGLTVVCGAKAGRILQNATLGALKAIAMGLFALLRLLFSGIAQLLSRKSSGSGPH